MPVSEARIQANRQNAAHSTGPKTIAGKEKSRRNAFKHGLTGEGIVLQNEDVAEIEHRLAGFREELTPTGEVSEALVRRAAILSVRLDRSVSRETAALRGRIRQAEADFFAPEGVDAATVAQLRAEALALAMFDPSPEASLARRYEAKTERGFQQALKDLRQLQKQANNNQPDFDPQALGAKLASFFQEDKEGDALEAKYLEPSELTKTLLADRRQMANLFPDFPQVDVPMTIGRRR